MLFIKHIIPLFLNATLVVCCLTFQGETVVSNLNVTYTSWVSSGFYYASNQNAYQINLKKAHRLFENSFSIFNFKCCLKHHNNLYAVEYRKEEHFYLPLQLRFLRALQKQPNLEADTFLG